MTYKIAAWLGPPEADDAKPDNSIALKGRGKEGAAVGEGEMRGEVEYYIPDKVRQTSCQITCQIRRAKSDYFLQFTRK